jgi:CMP-N-acetylneuraminic acid synthetase
MKISAVIIARKGSKRLKNKMHLKFFGNSLVENKIKQLIKSNVDEIIVGSNDQKLKKICDKFHNKKIIFIKREEKFCDEKSTTPNEMVKNMLSLFDTDLVLWAHLTNPFVNEKHYNEALKIYNKLNKKKYDSLFATTKVSDYFWDQNKKPLNHNPLEKSHTLLSTGKIKPLYTDNGSLFIRKHKDMIKDGRFWGNKGFMYIMNYLDGWDINTKWDLEVSQLKSFQKLKK